MVSRNRPVRRMIVAATVAIALVPVVGRAVVAQEQPPNVVIIVADDQRWDMLSQMPNVRASLVERGTTYTNAFVTDPLCCPSRTSILRGQHSHTTRIYEVARSFGGYGKVKKFGLQQSMIPTWLDAAGYETGMVGKYMNLYNPSKAAEVPPGWDFWAAHAPVDTSAYYYDYKLSYSPTGRQPAAVRSYGSTPADYSTRVFEGYAQEFIDGVPADSPFLLYFAPTAPHDPFTPDPDDAAAACSSHPERANFGEDVSDKPAWFAGRTWGKLAATNQRARWLAQCRALIGLDRAVGDIVSTLEASGRLSDTMFIYTSDNGMMHGEHRLSGKKTAYEESIRVPFIVRYDGVVAAGASDANLVLNIDIAPTVLQATGASAPALLPCSSPCVPAPIEGRSLFPLFADDATGWRRDFLIEHYDDPALAANQSVPAYCAVRTADGLKYVRADPDREPRYEELYDLRVDPFELDNRIADPAYADELAALRPRLQQLCSPTPPQYGF